MKYLVLLLILIGFTGTAFGQYSGDKLPPNTMMDPETGKEVLPPSYIDFYYSNSKFEKYSVIADNYMYVIPYIIPNGTISKISIDCNNAVLVLDVSTTVKQEWLTLALPRQLIDSKLGPQGDDTFMILVNSTEVKYSDIASEKLRIVIIPISNETSSIKIIGVNYPEHMGENTCDGKHNPPFAYLLSPLKQFKSGIDKYQIKCSSEKHVLVLRPNEKLACVYFKTADKLQWIPIEPVNGTYEIIKNNETFFVDYFMPDGKVIDMSYDEHANSITVNLKVDVKESIFYIHIPKALVDASQTYCDTIMGENSRGGVFMVLHNGEEIAYSLFDNTNNKNILTVPLIQNYNNLEFIGTCYV